MNTLRNFIIRSFNKKYGKPGASFEAFNHAVKNPETLDECDIDDETRGVLIGNIRRRLTPPDIQNQVILK